MENYYVFAKMKVGPDIFIPDCKAQTVQQAATMASGIGKMDAKIVGIMSHDFFDEFAKNVKGYRASVKPMKKLKKK